MLCLDCQILMDELSHKHDSLMFYECMLCDRIEVPESTRNAIRESLFHKGLKEHTKEFDDAVQCIMEEIRSGKRKYSVDTPDPDPSWEDPFPDQEGFGT